MREDLEDRLTAALHHGVGDVGSVVGLADGVRRRARSRRRRAVATTAVAVALVVGVPASVVALRGHGAAGRDTDRGAATTAPSPSPSPQPALAPGFRWETWHGVSVQVPTRWATGALDQWCADGGTLATAVVQRPDVSQTEVGCSPQSGYGLRFSVADSPGLDWPVASQHNDAVPDGAFVGTRDLDGVFVEVTTPGAPLAQQILDSVTANAGRPDPNGCASDAYRPSPRPESGVVVVCRYGPDRQLVQSERVTGADAERAIAAVDAATEPADCAPVQGPASVRLRWRDDSVFVYLDGCGALTRGDRPTRAFRLTSDVASVALAAGASVSSPAAG